MVQECNGIKESASGHVRENMNKHIYQLSETKDESLYIRTSPTCNHPHIFHFLSNWFGFLFRSNSELA